MSTLPTLTKTIDDDFVTTWYEIRPDAIDNILDATVVWAALRSHGVMTTQVGSDMITRTIRYGEQDATAVQKGDILPDGEPDLDTMARWYWRYIASHVQRSTFDDQKNAGKFKIKSYIAQRLEAARDGIEQKFEARALASEVTAETGKEVQGLNDLVPAYANRATGTYGQISRSNSWWQANYKAITTPAAVNLLTDMTNLYNTITANKEAPNLIIADQTLFEIYEQFAMDMTQVVKQRSGRMVDLGYDMLYFKGKEMIWSSDMTSENMLFLNTNRIEIVYDPQLWFDMSEFKPVPHQAERIAHILCALNIIGTEPRRNGRLYTA